jgi:hypothetical protein
MSGDDEGRAEVGVKPPKTGVRIGGGPPPGYLWNVVILAQVHHEAMKFLDVDQYAHMAALVRELARQDDPTHVETVDVRPVEAFHEVRDKGGILGGLNVRVFYCLDRGSRRIVVLGAIKKENDGPTPLGDKVRMRGRMRAYFASQ